MTAFRENLRGLAGPKADLLADSEDDVLISCSAGFTLYNFIFYLKEERSIRISLVAIRQEREMKSQDLKI